MFCSVIFNAVDFVAPVPGIHSFYRSKYKLFQIKKFQAVFRVFVDYFPRCFPFPESVAVSLSAYMGVVVGEMVEPAGDVDFTCCQVKLLLQILVPMLGADIFQIFDHLLQASQLASIWYFFPLVVTMFSYELLSTIS